MKSTLVLIAVLMSFVHGVVSAQGLNPVWIGNWESGKTDKLHISIAGDGWSFKKADAFSETIYQWTKSDPNTVVSTINPKNGQDSSNFCFYDTKLVDKSDILRDLNASTEKMKSLATDNDARDLLRSELKKLPLLKFRIQKLSAGRFKIIRCGGYDYDAEQKVYEVQETDADIFWLFDQGSVYKFIRNLAVGGVEFNEYLKNGKVSVRSN
jgi:hypothetical protein